MSSIKPIKGLKSYYPTDKGPIDTYQLGHDGRVEYLGAEIGTDHLNKGANTTDEWKKWAKERGSSSDEPGLIVSKRLGGSGIDSINLFPKGSTLDKTSWAEDEEKAYNEASEMKKWKKMKFFVKFEYPEVDSLRPSSIEYLYELPSGTVLRSKVKNEISSEPVKEPIEEDEEEYEYEYEEEEEEEEESPEVLEKEPEPSVQVPKKVEESYAPTTESSKKSPSPEKVTITIKSKPEVPFSPIVSPGSSYTFKTPSPTPTNSPIDYPPPTRSESPKPQKEQKERKLSTPKSADQGGTLFNQSDLIEMLPIIGTIKLAFDTLRALYNRNTNLAFAKAIQCGISALGDFNFVRAFARHGRILVKPITEQKLVGFANKAEPQLIIFGACKAGNQVLSSLRRILS